MKKLKYLLFFIPFCFSLNVFAKDVTNYIQYDTDNPTGTYKGDEIYNGSYNGKFDVKTRYNGKLSMVEFVLSSNYFDFNVNTVYTITLNMATNDWRNNFMGPQVIKLNSNGSQQTTNGSLSVSNFQFISRKSIKFNFKTNSSISPYLLFRLYSTDYATSNNIAITGDTNWNLSSIVITPATSSSGSGSGSGSSSSSSSTTCNNGLVISSSTYNYSDVDISSKYLGSSGDQVDYNNFGIISYIPISSNSTYYLSRNLSASSVANYCLYNSSKTLISCSQYGTSTSFTINTGNASYISLSLRSDYIFTLSTCKSPLDNQNENTQNIIDNQNQNTTNIIENNNDNTQQIIENNNDNTNALNEALSGAIGGASNGIINNNNQNTDKEIESQQVCEYINNRYIVDDNKYLVDFGGIGSSNLYGLTDYININNSKITVLKHYETSNPLSMCFYNGSKVLISCLSYVGLTDNYNVVIPSGAEYLRATINKSQNLPTLNICKNGNQSLNDSVNDLNDSINNSNVDSNVGTGFFDDFTSEDFGLSQIITIPLNTIQSLTSKTCVPLQVPIPFTNSNISLPCMTEIYETKFPSIYNLWKIVSFGIVAYLIAIDIFHIVKGFKDPESDKVEVLDL